MGILKRGGIEVKLRGIDEEEKKIEKKRIERAPRNGEGNKLTIEIGFLASYTGIIIRLMFTSPHRNSVWHINKSNKHFHRTKE